MDSIYKIIENDFSEKRRIHTYGVVDCAIVLAKRFDADVEKCKIAALYHDFFRGRDTNEINTLVKEYNLPEKYLGKRNLAHGKLAAEKMKRDFGVEDEEILNAVSFHTTGRANMTKVEMIVFLADAIEVNRDYPKVNKFRKIAEINLEDACLAVIDNTIEFLEKKNEDIDIDTLKAREWLLERKNNL